MTVDIYGNVWVTGTTGGALAPGQPLRGSADAFVAKYDTSGKFFCTSIKLVADNSKNFSFQLDCLIWQHGVAHFIYNFFLLSGTRLWVKTFGGARYEIAFGLVTSSELLLLYYCILIYIYCCCCCCCWWFVCYCCSVVVGENEISHCFFCHILFVRVVTDSLSNAFVTGYTLGSFETLVCTSRCLFLQLYVTLLFLCSLIPPLWHLISSPCSHTFDLFALCHLFSNFSSLLPLLFLSLFYFSLLL